jgi:Methyltransferase domain/Recombinase
VAKRRQRRRREKKRRHGPESRHVADLDRWPRRWTGRTSRLLARAGRAALGVSLATLGRRVVPVIATVKTEWRARLIPVAELERFLAERREEPRRQPRATRSGRRPVLPPDVVARIRREHAQGVSLGEIARRLDRDEIPTGQGGRQWWPSTVRAVLLRQKFICLRSGSARLDRWITTPYVRWVSFNVGAEEYDRFMGRYSVPLAPLFAEFAGVTAGQRVLDVGCGPGALTVELVRRLGVWAVDLSERIVAAGRAQHPGLRVRRAAAEKLPFDDRLLDAGLAQLVVHFMADPVVGLCEMVRVTRARGVVAACV